MFAYLEDVCDCPFGNLCVVFDDEDIVGFLWDVFCCEVVVVSYALSSELTIPAWQGFLFGVDDGGFWEVSVLVEFVGDLCVGDLVVIAYPQQVECGVCAFCVVDCCEEVFT